MEEVRQIVNARIEEKGKTRNAFNLATALFIGASSILFLTLFIVWAIRSFPDFEIPVSFYLNTIVILMSSILLYSGQEKIKDDDTNKGAMMIYFSGLLGIVFAGVQVLGWREIMKTQSVSQNIIIPFTAVHFLHIAIGVTLLYTVFKKVKSLNIHSKDMSFLTNVSRFWHFLGLIWILFILVS